MKNIITTGYKRETDNDLVGSIHRVLGKMDNNPNFTDQPAVVADIKKDLPAYQKAIIDASGGDEVLMSIKKDIRAKMIVRLTEVKEYVTLICNGDRTMLLSSGFTLNRSRGEKGLLPIKELQVTAERRGEASTRVSKVPGARAYMHQYTLDPLSDESVWVTKFTADASHTFTDLKSKERYLFQVIAIGLNGREEKSPPVSRVIQ